jgi:uncharacterized protein
MKVIRLHEFVDGKHRITLAIRVIPRAKKNEISQIMEDGTIKVRLSAPPVEGKANRSLIEYLSKVLDVPETAIEIAAGSKSRNKIVSIIGFDPSMIERQLLNRLT